MFVDSLLITKKKLFTSILYNFHSKKDYLKFHTSYVVSVSKQISIYMAKSYYHLENRELIRDM